MIQLIVTTSKTGGVYDFSCKLQDAIGHDEVRLVHLSRENAVDWEIGPNDTVVLQMSGYGFAKRGAPLWLLREIESRRKVIKTLGVFFHELYAFGPPWTSSFWLSPVQRHITRRMAELSDFWMTNREGSAQWLRKYTGDKPHAVLPVFSNVGELSALPVTRLPRIIVFGSPELRKKTYQAAGNELFAWARRVPMEIHDVGSPISDSKLSEILCANSVILHGRLTQLDISKLMEKAMFGFLAYPISVISKSGVFAAFCAHGVCPILISDTYVTTDGLVPGKHYLKAIPSDMEGDQLASRVGCETWSWYQSHRLDMHVKSLRQFIDSEMIKLKRKYVKRKLNLLIIHYNNPQALERTIQSYLASGIDSCCIHIFDNDSSPNNKSELVKLGERYEINILYADQNLGWGKAINKFIESRDWSKDDVLAISAHDALLRKYDWSVVDDEFSDNAVLFICPQYPLPVQNDFSIARSFHCKPTYESEKIEVVVGHATLCFTRPSVISKLPYDESCFLYGCESEIFLRAHDYGYKTILTNRIIVENPVTDSSAEFRTLAFGINSIYIAKLRFGLFGYITRMLVVAMSTIRLALKGEFGESVNRRKVLIYSLRTGGAGFKEYLQWKK